MREKRVSSFEKQLLALNKKGRHSMNFCDKRKIAKGLKKYYSYFADDNSFDVKRHLKEFFEETIVHRHRKWQFLGGVFKLHFLAFTQRYS